MNVLRPDLEQLRLQLVERREALLDRHLRVERDLARSIDPLVADSADQAIQTANDEVLERIDDSAKAELAAIDRALSRLDRGQYGICMSCDGDIEPARLKALPYATTCFSCANG